MTTLRPVETRTCRSFAALLALLGAGACSATPGEAARPPGPHPYDHVLGEGQQHVPNPDVKLRREYWIVVEDAERQRHYMVPRPDGDPRIVAECEAEGPLASLFRAAALCQPGTSADVERVNALSRHEAMTTSTFLHERLRFVPREGAVEPYLLTTDLIDLCNAFPAERNGVLRAICDEELRYARGGARYLLRRSYDAEETAAIAARLNDLYGIE